MLVVFSGLVDALRMGGLLMVLFGWFVYAVCWFGLLHLWLLFSVVGLIVFACCVMYLLFRLLQDFRRLTFFGLVVLLVASVFVLRCVSWLRVWWASWF